MRIALYTPNYPGITTEGGIGSYTRALSLGISELDHEVHVLTPGTQPSVSDGPIRVHFTRTGHVAGLDKLLPGMGSCWRISRAMRRLVREHRIEIVEFSNWEGFGLLFLKTANIPVVVRLSTSSREAQIIDGSPPTRWQRWDVRRERWLVRTARVLVTHSDAHRRLMAEEAGIPADRIQVHPLGVDVFPSWVRPLRPPGPPLVVYLGRLEHRKGTVELLQAIPEILRSAPGARFVLIGADRPHCPGGRTHAQYLEQDFPPEVRRQVTLAGRLPQHEVDQWLQTADVFVAPSRYESFGLIFLEAMRWGTPVIGTTAGGIPEIVEDGRSGLLVPPESPGELARALIRLLLNLQEREALGKAGRQRVEGEFSVQRMAQRAADLYDEVIRARRSSGGPVREATHAR